MRNGVKRLEGSKQKSLHLSDILCFSMLSERVF